jgi:TRAP-type C4-dicarboxylate transport system permease small subunit
VCVCVRESAFVYVYVCACVCMFSCCLFLLFVSLKHCIINAVMPVSTFDLG